MSPVSNIEKSNRLEIQQYQEIELRKLVEYVAAHSPFYKSHFLKHGIDPGKIRTLNDLAKIPVTTKDDLQRQNWDFLCVPKESIVEFTSTSGTLGKPVTIGLTKSDVTRLSYNEYRSFMCADGSAKDLYQLMLTLDRQFMAGIAYYEGLRKLGAGIIRLGPGSPSMQLDTILRLEPSVLIVVPSFLVKLVAYAQQEGVDLNSTSVKKVICIGESIRKVDLSLNEIGHRIKAAWNIALYGTYASTEMQTAFTECSFGVGGHHNPELIIIEFLDNNGLPVKFEEPGEITITTLGVEGMPLVRYKTGDIATGYDQTCKCGRNTIRVGPIIGRKQQMIKLKGTTLYPQGVYDVLNKIEGVSDYVVEIAHGDLETDNLILHLLVKNQAVGQMVIDNFSSSLRVTPEIIIVDQEKMESLQLGNNSRKISRFMDTRKS